MASCDEEFSLLTDHNQHYRYLQPKLSSNDAVKVSTTQESSENGALFEVNPYEPGEFDSDPDPKNCRVCDSAEEEKRRKERESDDVSDGSFNNNNNNTNKKPKHHHHQNPLHNLPQQHQQQQIGAAAVSSGEYRKDREEWSDAAIECLLDAYTEKYTQLNRGNLRGRDWEEVAVIVSQRCENQNKSVEQCKNKVDNLKKRYKLERHRMTSAGIEITHWPWFKKMEAIVANSMSSKAVSDDDKVGASSAGSAGRQLKRCSVGAAGSLGQVNNLKSKSISNSKWQRVVFKISGAALAGNGPQNVDPKAVMLIAREVAMAYRSGVQVAIVIGGRNFFCGDTWMTATGADRSTTYQIGMMATVMNSVLLQSAIEKMGVQTRAQTAFALPEVGEPYNRKRAIRHLEKGRVVIFGGVSGGSGNPLFSTDTTAALRATDINAHAVLKGINVDAAAYDCNSRNNGFTFEHISFKEAASRGAPSMDVMALTFCEENAIPVVLFNLLEPGNISRALCGEQIGTLIDQTGVLS